MMGPCELPEPILILLVVPGALFWVVIALVAAGLVAWAGIGFFEQCCLWGYIAFAKKAEKRAIIDLVHKRATGQALDKARLYQGKG